MPEFNVGRLREVLRISSVAYSTVNYNDVDLYRFACIVYATCTHTALQHCRL